MTLSAGVSLPGVSIRVSGLSHKLLVGLREDVGLRGKEAKTWLWETWGTTEPHPCHCAVLGLNSTQLRGAPVCVSGIFPWPTLYMPPLTKTQAHLDRLYSPSLAQYQLVLVIC